MSFGRDEGGRRPTPQALRPRRARGFVQAGPKRLSGHRRAAMRCTFDKTLLTGNDDQPAGAISHAVAQDFPHCCERKHWRNHKPGESGECLGPDGNRAFLGLGATVSLSGGDS